MSDTTKPAYPVTQTVDQVDNYHGVEVADPYRWLEDTDSEATAEWIEAQDRLTQAYLSRISERGRLVERIASLWNFPRRSAPRKRGGRYFQMRNTGLQNQNVLYVMENLGDEGRVLLDPNTLSADGTVSVSSWAVSEDGRRLAYALSESGSDWLRWRVRDVGSAHAGAPRDLDDEVRWSKFSGAAWLHDGSGFYYGRYDAPQPGEDLSGTNYFQKLHFHRIGEPQEQDTLVYERPDQPEWGFGAEVSEDGRYLVIGVWQGTDVRNRLFYQDLAANGAVVSGAVAGGAVAGGAVAELVPDLEALYQFVGNDGPVFYLRTDLDAPRCRMIAVDTTQPDRASWRTVIPESTDLLELVLMAGDEFVCLYVHDAHHVVRRYSLSGESLGEIALPELGAIGAAVDTPELTGRRGDPELFYGFWSFLSPLTIYRYHLSSGESSALFVPPLDFDPSPYVTRQVFATSRDGTKVPMFLTHRRDLHPDGANPTLLLGYGGFDISLLPSFAPDRLAWLEMGGVYASANLRGGGEYGREWHEGGMIHNKQNVFDDFIACAEYLIGEGITSTAHLGIMGGSNGGLLVGAALTQRPELFGAAVPRVGVLDMLRFHKFTIGWAWVSDYGSADDPEQFGTLYRYSPLHNIRPGTAYPPTLVVTADHDDRVVPGHSFKFTAALQAAQGGDAPILARIQRKAGHGHGKPTRLLIEEAADVWAFLAATLGAGSGRVRS